MLIITVGKMYLVIICYDVVLPMICSGRFLNLPQSSKIRCRTFQKVLRASREFWNVLWQKLYKQVLCHCIILPATVIWDTSHTKEPCLAADTLLLILLIKTDVQLNYGQRCVVMCGNPCKLLDICEIDARYFHCCGSLWNVTWKCL